MRRLDGEHEQMAAALHDGLEDTATTAETLQPAGCPEPVITAVHAPNKHPGEPLEQAMAQAAATQIGSRCSTRPPRSLYAASTRAASNSSITPPPQPLGPPMGADRINDGTDANTEAVEEEPAADRRPPPPPDRPGTDGYPSRADSRNGAAAANESTPVTDEAREEKPDTAQASQETSREQDLTAGEDRSKTPGTSGESSSKDDGVSDQRYETGRGEADTGGTPEREQRPEEPGGREQRLDGQAAPHDSTATAGTDKQPVSPSVAQRIEEKGTVEKSAAEASESANEADTSGVGVGDRPNSAPREAKDALADTQQPPHDSPDAPGDAAGDDTRKPAHPADDIAEVATKTAEIQGQPGSADKPQPDPPDQDSPGADARPDGKQDTDQASNDSTRIMDYSEGTPEAGKTTANTDDAYSDGTETPIRRIEPLDEAHLRAADDSPGEPTSTADEKQGPGSELSVEDEPSSEGAEAAWITGGPDIAGDLPTGAELVKMENDKQSRAERARRKIYESGDEVLDDVGKVVNRVDQIFERPPTGHPETRTGPEVIPAPHEGISAGDAATALIAAGVVVGEIFRRGREKLKQRKGV